MAYGGASGFSAAGIETLFDGINNAYGDGVTNTEKWAKGIVNKLKLKEDLQKAIKAGIDDFGEGFETFLTDISNQALKSAYNDKNMFQNLSEADRKQRLADEVANVIMAMLLKEKDS